VARLTAKDRAKLPAKDFGELGARKFPIVLGALAWYFCRDLFSNQ